MHACGEEWMIVLLDHAVFSSCIITLAEGGQAGRGNACSALTAFVWLQAHHIS